ncbi:MAG TPA: phage holin family protein [Polyangiaceae bacterium]|nr:phage holin family protein [Polyangiaceae bacterium]
MTQAADTDQTSSSGRLVQSAMMLAKAEIKLAVAETRAVAKQAAIAVALSWASLSLVQVLLVLIAALPALAAVRDWPVALLSVAPCLVITGIVGFLALQRWKRVSELAGARPNRTQNDVINSNPSVGAPFSSPLAPSLAPTFPLSSTYPGTFAPSTGSAPSSFPPPENLTPSETRAVRGALEGDDDARAQRNVKAG